jgi:hypothetical protein
MSSIFQDGIDIYADATWESGPWRNYIRKPKAVPLKFDSEAIKIDFFCTEEDFIGYKCKIGVKNHVSSDYISRIDLLDNADSSLSLASGIISSGNMEGDEDGMSLLSTLTGHGSFTKHSSPAFYGEPTYSWIMPGIGFRFGQAINYLSSFTSTDNFVTYTPTEADLSPKSFDGGIHCWVKLDVVSAGFNYFYTKPIPSSYHGKNATLIINSLGNKHAMDDLGGNQVLSMELVGSVDNINYTVIGDKILDDINPVAANDTDGAAMQIKYVINGIDYGKYNYYKFRWNIDAGVGTEEMYKKMNFMLLSLYPIPNR